MRNFVKVLGIVLVLLMLVLPGKTAFAHGDGDDCGCGDYLQGAERNKVVASILKSDAFKVVKADKKIEGYQFAGANKVMAVKMPGPDGIIYTMVAVPFVHENGEVLLSVFADGVHMGDGPPPVQ
ncbi:hypothetical protein [Fredinandcohnia onubensis]|uniref:hypothetical protein n=1 Tax=Fredinandcohnia onubensis TaxID=1571209 RepID=UPI001156A420|nr:hypothetical protein [Fredinandcohnia onubensis]